MARRKTPPPSLPTHRPKSHWSVKDCFKEAGPRIRSFLHRDYEIGSHTHDFPELNMVLRGRGHHYLEDGHVPVRQGDVFVVPPTSCHGYTRDGKLDVQHLLLHPGFLHQHALRLRALPGYLLLFTVEPYFRAESRARHFLRLDAAKRKTAVEVFDRIEALQGSGDRAADLAVESLGLYLVAMLCLWYVEQYPPARNADHRHDKTRALGQVLDLVAKRYPERLCLRDLAEAAHMQRSHFCRVFREATGLTPMQYLNHHRVQVARQLLSETGRSVTEIGAEVGFYDTPHFSRTFARLVGMSPKRYRDRSAPSTQAD